MMEATSPMPERPDFDETIQQLKDALTVTAAMSLRIESRTQEHDQWLEEHERRMGRVERNLDRLAEMQPATEEKLQKLIDSLREGRNGKG
jgi:hypothetical protein